MTAALAASLTLMPLAARAQSRERGGEGEDDPQCRRQREAALISGEIVVCAKRGRQDEFRIRSREQAQSDYAVATMDGGAARAPSLGPPPCKPSLLTICPKFGGAPPPAIEVDFTKLPEAPPGSDAARLNDEEPRG